MASSERQDYIERLLALYRRTPETSGVVRRADRCLAARLYDRRVPLELVELALRLAAARRQLRPPSAPPLATIRSLHYFLPVLDELSDPQLDPDYLNYLRYRLTTPDRSQTQRPDSHR
jgi:hypothetical protein